MSKFFDFTSDEEFNLNDEYDKLFKEKEVVIETEQSRKNKDADDIIREFGPMYMEGSSLVEYEKMFMVITDFLTKYSVDSHNVESLTEGERNKLFGYAREMFNTYEAMYRNLVFNFELSKEEWKYVWNVLINRLSYDGNELFNFWKLKIDFLDPTNQQYKELPKDLPGAVVTISVENMVLLSHLIMKWQERPTNAEKINNYWKILSEIGKMTKLFNAYGVVVERIANKFNHWVNAINALDGLNTEEERIEAIQKDNG